MIIQNARIVTPAGTVHGSVHFEGSQITKIESSIPANGEGIDAHGLFLLPGAIDSHVHFRDPGQTHKEDFLTGSRGALAGGVTTVLDMPNNSPPIDSLEMLAKKREAAAKSVCDYAFHFGASTQNAGIVGKAGEESDVAGLKVYLGSSTGNLLVTQFGQLWEHFSNFKKTVCVHAEDEEALQYFLQKLKTEKQGKPLTVTDHNLARPPLAAGLAANKAVYLAQHAQSKLHVCHASTALELEAVKRAKKAKLAVSCEATPHHLFLSEKDAKRLENYARMNPPLRSKRDQAALWKGIKQGLVDCVATDHAPHTKEEKAKPYEEAPSGVPGVQTMLPLLLNAATQGKLSIEQVAKLTAENPAKVFGLYRKGRIERGFDADFTLVDLGAEWTVHGDKLESKCGWTPFEGMVLRGKVKDVWLRGDRVVEDGVVTAKEGLGKPVHSK